MVIEKIPALLEESFTKEFSGFLSLEDNKITFTGTISNPFAFDRKRQIDFYYNQISLISTKRGIFPKIIISTTGSKDVTINSTVSYNETVEFTRKINRNISQLQNSSNNSNDTSNSMSSIILQIEELAKLKDKGIISESEFDAKKKILLNKII
ncbi:SHOCT domain-containing protein [Clostridium estertheticum]|uniref:SHOCT domain-containing protein n=1 Tax=Clostridium estertheticum TaxID=238834 RepID=UPI001CF21DD0|nr:SHOCT domain-containing protein [Clostridium estertheticum]MCB2339092.1 SHOCT domain-containing protein [Clostridium estertheticum]